MEILSKPKLRSKKQESAFVGATHFPENISSLWLRDKNKKNYENKNLLYDGTVCRFAGWVR